MGGAQQGVWTLSRDLEEPRKDFKFRGEAGESRYLGRWAQKQCGPVRDCTTSAQIYVENQRVGRLLVSNLGCLPKISLIKASAFCSLRWVVFLFSTSEARGFWEMSLLLFLRAWNKAEGSVKARAQGQSPKWAVEPACTFATKRLPSPGTTGSTVPPPWEPFPNATLHASAHAIPVLRIPSLLLQLENSPHTESTDAFLT